MYMCSYQILYGLIFIQDTIGILMRLRSVMVADSKATSNPVRVDIVYPWEADSKAFNTFTYSKV